MTLKRFREIVETYGTKPARWPHAERDAAQLFARDNRQAQSLLSQAALLDNMLDAYRVAPAGAALTARIVVSAGRQVQRTLPWVSLLWRGLGMAGVGLAGAAAGALLVATIAPIWAVLPDNDRSVATAFDAPYDEVDDIQ